jgi:hypothetical protein
MILKNNKYQENLNRFNFYVKEIINKANATYKTPDCYPFLKLALDAVIKKSAKQIEAWDKKTDVQTLAYKTLFNVASDTLTSGEMHIYRGALDPMLPGDKLQYIVLECINYFSVNGFITTAQAEEQREIMYYNISVSG